MFFMVAVGATIAAVQNVDELKEPLVKSMTKYDPNSSNSSNLDITRAWDDVQREVSTVGTKKVVLRGGPTLGLFMLRSFKSQPES